MKSICYVHKDIGNIERGGISTLFKTLAIGMRDAGWKVYCITQQELEIDGVETVTMEKERDPLVYSKKVSEVITKIKPDIAECSTWRFELLDYLRSDNRYTKIVVRCEPAAEIFFDNMDQYSQSEKELCQKADHRTAVSEFAKHVIEDTYQVKVEQVIYNGIDSNKIRAMQQKSASISISNDKVNIFWCGKATKMKGYDCLEKIINASDLDKYNWIINLGNSPEEVVWSPETKDSVTFISNITKEEQISIWAKCDLSISTSRNEGFGLVVAESLALGVPVLLNQNCEVFSEFLPNDGVELFDPENMTQVFKIIDEIKNRKSEDSYLPEKFDSKAMIESSIVAYNKLIL